MPPEITTIQLALPLKLGSVNCYLIKTDNDYILIDTGSSNRRVELEKKLENAGCHQGNLKLIVLTHGDFDHIGNAAYLRQKFGTPIAIHADDAGMLERGDMFWNRKKGNALLRKIAPTLFGFGPAKRCNSDIALEDSSDLSAYGCAAKVLHLPGHSAGSIGILTPTGDLFCGDLLENIKRPALNSIMDDVPTAQASIERLKSFRVKAVYPGHGQSFSWEQFMTSLT